MKGLLISVVGPTAIGKTKLAIDIATHFNTEIISADSRQFYQEMSIGTAKPSIEELAAVPHHFVDFLPITQLYSAGDFEKDALLKLEELFQQHETVVMVGGSGMYVDAVCKGFDVLPNIEPHVREQLNTQLQEEGLGPLLIQLEQLDPDYFHKVDKANKQRVVRALEVCLSSGESFTSFRKNNLTKRPFEILTVGLTMDRPDLYDLINKRVDQMMVEGLFDEVKSLYAQKDLNALQTVGYRELFAAIDKQCTVGEAITQIKTNTRRFAKRQLTWFQKNETTQWFQRNEQDKIIPFLEGQIKA
ncbi:MAG: tRNA dimethylallyltransferase [Flavobacteriales bacterium]|jgi:tRNA dimethylallyltransferase